ncbi:MAG TPA: hypothetical protein VF874_05500 [Mycobacterium sp.]
MTTDDGNMYGAPPGSGISMPPYYLPTPSVKNRNNYFPQSERIGDGEIRITFMGSNPWAPRLSQAGTCTMVELGTAGRLTQVRCHLIEIPAHAEHLVSLEHTPCAQEGGSFM